MPGTAYEWLMARNARLVRFLDENTEIASVLMRVVTHLKNYCAEQGISPKKLNVRMIATPDGRKIIMSLDQEG